MSTRWFRCVLPTSWLWQRLLLLTLLLALTAALLLSAALDPGAARSACAAPLAHPTRASHPLLATAAISQNVDFVGQIGGPSYAVAVSGTLAYVGIGPRLLILDVSAPATPTVVGQSSVMPDIVEGVAVAGSYAYVAAERSGLHVINITTPTVPTEVGFYDTPGYAHDVVVAGNYAYIADNDFGLRVVNVTIPTAPTEVGFYDTPGYAQGVVVTGSYAYVADSGSGLRVINVVTPTAPVEVGFYNTPGYARGVEVVGNYAYVADYTAGLRVLNIATPTAPTEAGFYNMPGVAQGVAVVGIYAYVTEYEGGLRVINITTPTAPTEVGFYDTPGSSYGVVVTGNYAYVADYTRGLRAVNIATPTAPMGVGYYDPLGDARGVAVAGTYAYVADYEGGLRIINIATPTAPTAVGAYDTSSAAENVAVAQGYAYIADRYDGLRVVDITTSTAPVEVGFYDTLGDAQGVAVAGTYAYVADYGDGLRVINITTPTAPTEVGFCDTPGSAYGVAVAGSYAYVADDTHGLRVVNITTPTVPTEVGFKSLENARDVAVAGNYAYVADRGAGLRIINIATPTMPAEVGIYDTPGSAYGVAVAGSYAYVADGASLRVINIVTPTTPTEVGFYDTPGVAWDIAVADGYAYIADWNGGLIIVRYTPQVCLPLTGINLSGPTQGATRATLIFTASLQPVTATLPIIYTWSSDGLVGGQGTAQAIYQWTNAGNKTIQVTARNCGGQDFNAIQNVAISAPTTGDAYEPDDLCSQASTLSPDGTVQAHTFHQLADPDWAQFIAVSGTTYIVQATSTSAGADLNLELHDRCDHPVMTDTNALGPSANLVFQAPADGMYYIKVLNHVAAVYGPAVTYELGVRAQLPGGVVLIVAGHDDNYRSQDNILYAANLAYRTFLRGGIPKVNIRYLSTVSDPARTDADDDRISDVYTSSASSNVETALTTWAADLINSPTPFYLYLVDHGLVDLFLADGSGDPLTPTTLDGWLTPLEDRGARVSVIYEGCHSGSFIDVPATLAKPGRVVIASTGRINSAYAHPGRGAYFSDAFFTALGQNQDLYTSFVAGTAAVRANTELWQTPWLDDNGNGVPLEADDGALARSRGLSDFALVGGRPPVIDQVLPPPVIQNGQGMVRAQVRDDGNLAALRVWAILYPPSFVEPAPPPDGTMPELNLPRLELSDTNQDGEYVGWYEAFTERGAYQAVVYAEDAEGNLSQPAALAIWSSWPLYLPLVMRGL